jgi:hypothetical protein
VRSTRPSAPSARCTTRIVSLGPARPRTPASISPSWAVPVLPRLAVRSSAIAPGAAPVHRTTERTARACRPATTRWSTASTATPRLLAGVGDDRLRGGDVGRLAETLLPHPGRHVARGPPAVEELDRRRGRPDDLGERRRRRRPGDHERRGGVAAGRLVGTAGPARWPWPAPARRWPASRAPACRTGRPSHSCRGRTGHPTGRARAGARGTGRRSPRRGHRATCSCRRAPRGGRRRDRWCPGRRGRATGVRGCAPAPLDPRSLPSLSPP